MDWQVWEIVAALMVVLPLAAIVHIIFTRSLGVRNQVIWVIVVLVTNVFGVVAWVAFSTRRHALERSERLGAPWQPRIAEATRPAAQPGEDTGRP